VGQRDAGSLDDVADLSGSVGACGDDFAVLFDGGLLEAVEIVEEWLPLRLDVPGLAQAGQLLGECQPKEGAEDVAADGGIRLVVDRPRVKAGLAARRSAST
jgi:hypothetical protein